MAVSCRYMKSIAKHLTRGRYTNVREVNQISGDVPKGHCAVYVGPQRLRFVIPTDYLSHSFFKSLLDKAAEEFGFGHEMGVVIPCDEADFQHYTNVLERRMKMKKHSSFSIHL